MNKNVDDKMDLRRKNLRIYQEAVGYEQQSLAKKLKVSASYLSQLSSGYRPFTEKTARDFEKKLGVQAGFLDSEEISGTRLKSQSSDDRLRALVIAAIDSALKANRKTAFKEDSKYGKLIELVYEDTKARGMPESGWLARLVRMILEEK